ncbi:unnamed protein product, partial [Mesorhabditis spiculigera]
MTVPNGGAPHDNEKDDAHDKLPEIHLAADGLPPMHHYIKHHEDHGHENGAFDDDGLKSPPLSRRGSEDTFGSEVASLPELGKERA